MIPIGFILAGLLGVGSWVLARARSGRREALRALRESETRYRTLVESMPGVTYAAATDEVRTTTYVSRRIEELLGVSAEAFDDNPRYWDEHLHPDDRERVLDEVAISLETGETLRSEYRMICDSGEVVWVRDEAIILTNEDGSPFMVQGVMLDITERRRAESGLQLANRILNQERHMFVTGPVVVFKWRSSEGWPVEYVSPNVEQVFGYAAEELLSGDVMYADIVSQEDLDRVADEVRDRSTSGAASFEHLPYRILRKDGSTIWIADYTTILRNGEGTITHYLGYVVDITERKRLETLREQAHALLQTVVDGIPETLMVLNRDYTIALANRAAREAAGIDDPMAAGLTCHEASHGLTAPCEDGDNPCPLRKVLEDGAPVTLEHVHHDATGAERDVEVVAAPIFGEDGEIVQVIESVRDISARRRAEVERLALERQLQHTQKLESLGVLAGGVAHDFNNLLMAILGNADLALGALPADTPARRKVEEIVGAAERAAGLTSQLLAYSGKGRFVIQPILLNEVVEEMSQMLEVSISKKATLDLDLADALPALDGDATQVRQVVLNLITNASEAIGKANGVITISTGAMYCEADYLEACTPASQAAKDRSPAKGAYVYVEVIDTGCGMDKATQERMLDPFFSTKSAGRGLGMAAVGGIVGAHKGAIRVHSEVGRGTTVRVLFPAAATAEGQPLLDRTEPREGEVEPTGPCSGTVLVVDDEERVREVAKHMLAKLGFKVLTAADGREALAIFRHHAGEIVCVLLDQTMPHLNGDEVFRKMRATRPDVKVILSSGYDEQETAGRVTGAGLAGFIQKPYRFAALAAKVKEVLG